MTDTVPAWYGDHRGRATSARVDTLVACPTGDTLIQGAPTQYCFCRLLDNIGAALVGLTVGELFSVRHVTKSGINLAGVMQCSHQPLSVYLGVSPGSRLPSCRQCGSAISLSWRTF